MVLKFDDSATTGVSTKVSQFSKSLALDGGRNIFLNIGEEMTLTETSSFEVYGRDLTLPDLPEEYLDIVLVDNESEVENITETFPLAVNDVTAENVLEIRKLTNRDDVKEVYLLELSTKFNAYAPGDTIGILARNKEEDVQRLFDHLGISALSWEKYKVTTLHKIFTDYLDIQCIPKKSLIRVLSEFTKNLDEKHELEKLCSKENSDLYIKEILERNKTFLELLLSHPSCCPPAARLLENLPRLLPRPYSIASSPIASPSSIKIVFSVIKKENETEGLCTGMMKKLQKSDKVNMFFRKCNGFNLPKENIPLILIGPGTGIAPFMGFLEHRNASRTKGNIWLFYGCRSKTGDYLFEKELQEYLDCGVLSKLYVSFSRNNESQAKYVQDNIEKHGEKLTKLIFEENALIYVCGDAKNMRKDIQNSFIRIFETHTGMTNKEATDCLKKLQKEKKYLQDIWI